MSRARCEHDLLLTEACALCARPTDRSVQAIAARLQAVARIPIRDDTRGQKHYGLDLGIGQNTLKTLWRCTEDYTHPAHDQFAEKGWDLADIYCDSHYATVDDEAALAFLIQAREDMAVLLAALGVQIELTPEDPE